MYRAFCSSSESKETKSTSEGTDDRKESVNRSNVRDYYGYDLYPERKGDKYKPSLSKVALLGEGTDLTDKYKCEKKVYECLKTSPLVKLMMKALKSSGCAVDIRRHISCEVCDPKVSGGYDPEVNQVIICQNLRLKKGIIQGILTHEMIHMFDYCRNDLDFKNLEHLACTEIRAANLTHCSFLSAWGQGDASPWNFKKAHAECVKTKAIWSVVTVRNISFEEGCKVVNKVFDKCYADMEPIGRRVRNSEHMYFAYDEAYLYGYDS